mgnify:CR=1 FL=1
MVTYPKDWDVVQLGLKCDVTSSKRVFESEWSKHGIPFLRTRDIASFHAGEEQKDKLYISEKTYAEKIASSGIPQKGDLLVTGVGTIGLPYLIDTDDRIYFKDGNILWIKKNEDFFYPKWLYLLFLDKHIKQQITDYSGFTTVGTFTIKNAKKLSVPMPSVPEQKAIASALSAFDTYIDSLTELIEKKRNIRDGALEDLVSGRTRLEGFADEWIDGKIGDVLKILHGRNQRTVESYSGKYPILGTGGVIGKASEYLCNWECVLIGRKGTIDKPIYMNTPFWTIDTLYYSIPAENQCVKYQYYLFCTIDWYSYTESSGRPSLAKKVIESIPIRIPKYEEQVRIAETITAMDKEITNLEAERDKMMQIREGAMDDLLTGRVRLKV